ncbi:fatty acid desaturase [Acidocella sp.]|uniref:fatty acid desaturase family protein n=1 Tax=Acidocella sp. TaxID=50710 RepID=UPI002628FC54|nr:fatty acid desaturase [Acidocella sp.]
MKAASLFRYPGSAGYNVAGLAYAMFGYVGGLRLITPSNLLLNVAGTVLLAHSLVVCAYFIHEFAHGTVFRAAANNDRGGEVMAWITGACFASYHGLKEKHLRHHAERMDVAEFDYRKILRRAPTWACKAVLALEWAYIPAIELLMHGLVVQAQYKGSAAMRRRANNLLASRISFFVLLGLVAPRALACYAVAYLMMLQVLRFMDAYQHTFDVCIASSSSPASDNKLRDRAYEHANTYSNILSLSNPYLNLLTLNFAYHNAHHARPAAPWHELPALHEKLYGRDQTQVLTARELLRSYHCNRVKRILAPDYGEVHPEGDRAHDFLGAVGVSFLTAI